MIAKDQAAKLSQQYKINQTVIVREYLQLLFLKELYSEKFSKWLFFKGGTAIRLGYGGYRFSEDLDFSVALESDQLEQQLNSLFNRLTNLYPLTFKERKSISGKTYLMTGTIPQFEHEVYIRLDFSLRADSIEPISLLVDNRGYPIIMSNFIRILSKDEILAEKIRALMNRDKFRDLYDLWILQQLGAKFRLELVNQKLAYYNEEFNREAFVSRLNSINQTEFIRDLKPFIPADQREQLGEMFEVIKTYLLNNIH